MKHLNALKKNKNVVVDRNYLVPFRKNPMKLYTEWQKGNKETTRESQSAA